MNAKIVLALISGAGMVAQQIIAHEIKKRQSEFVQQTLTNMADSLFVSNVTFERSHPETKPNDRATERAFKNIVSHY